MIEPIPEPGQLFIVQKHHEIRQHGIAVYSSRADLAHQVHTHRVAAERKESRVTETQNAAISPNQIDRQRQHRITQIFADERETVRRQVKSRLRGHYSLE